MKKQVLRTVIVLFWLGCMIWLFRYEAFPEWFTRTLSGYRGMLSGGPVILDSWMKITFQGTPIGYSHTRVDTNDKDPAGQYVVDNQTFLRLKLMGDPEVVNVHVVSILDALYQLQRFAFSMSSRRYSARITGKRVDREDFAVTIRAGAGPQHLKVKIPDDVVLYSPLLEMSLGRMKPGQKMTVRTIDPATLATIDVLVHALRRETIIAEGREQEATMLSIQMEGMETKTWVSKEGRVLRQETPFGWTMEACSPDKALAYLAEKNNEIPDMLRAMAVPCKGDIRRPRKARRLKLKLTGLSVPVQQLDSNRQEARQLEDGGVEVVTQMAQEPAEPFDLERIPKELKSDLASSPFLQADNPDIVRRARAIIKGKKTPAEKARALYEWVYRNVKKKPTVSLPSALDVLHHMEGDCNEHTYLLVALARASGIPARIYVGILYNEGAFYYHAWPALYIGDWWEMDPTIGQLFVDATHVALLEGEVASQLQLLGMMGKLKAEVLSEED